MSFSCGLVGLTNVGKSTLFNVLIKKFQAEVANYPFCTIEPNLGIIEIPDERLEVIAKKEKISKIVPSYLKLIDIAGLVRGASKGEGLGNQFLAHIREVDVIVFVLRAFEDPHIVNVLSKVDPLEELEILKLELILKDLETVEKRLNRVLKLAKACHSQAKEELKLLEKIKNLLESEKMSYLLLKEDPLAYEYAKKELFLLTAKPFIYVLNMGEENLKEERKYIKLFEERIKNEAPVIKICSKLEYELLSLSPEEVEEFKELYCLQESPFKKLIRAIIKLLDLIFFFTFNEEEVRAWQIKKGTPVVKAAGKIHSDFEKYFVVAEVINFERYKNFLNLSQAKEKGEVRLEGKSYIVEDGDIIYLRIGK
ncbi:MAG: redox-regulated ATPase YchF [Thermodesulfobacteriaceae bacterium]|nr:redox-regulated ATPase YchF [Thermodesulfobacteriaceae bacterium]MCX8041149.1 redox-regulated ATPase YchF [Thermodesulfobacteriaceae bacterium]MDW8135800.1 redox-regulated ATPase YchF [Thermodesulfobacterium sp.]